MENEEIKKRIENAQRFESILPLFSREERQQLKYGPQEIAGKLLAEKGIRDSSEILLATDSWLSYWNTEVPNQQTAKKPEVVKTSPFAKFLSSLATLAQGFAVATSILKPQKEEQKKEEPKPEEQPRTRFEQMEKAGKIVSVGNQGDSSWGESEPTPMPQPDPIPRGMNLPRVPGLRQIPSKRILRQSLRRPGQEGSSRGSPILKNKAKKQLKKKLLGAAKKRAAMALLGSLGLSGIIIVLVTVVCILVFFIIVVAVGCYVGNNPLGDLLGVNYCKTNQNSPIPHIAPGPNPTPDKPTSITFQGGEAYLTTGDGCRINCPRVDKNDIATIKVEIFLNTDEFDKDIKNVRAIMQINSVFFSNIKATGAPEISTVPTLNNYSLYRWRLTNPKAGENHYTFTVTGKVESESGETNVVLTMSGVTIIDKNLGDLYKGADSPPSSDRCGTWNWPLPNFGDPQCSFSYAKWDEVLRLTETKHPEFIPFWKDIGRTEGNINTRGGGTYGKFQMNSSRPPFSQQNLDNQLRGDVPWQRQIQNAVTHNNNLIKNKNAFGFWGTAMCLCWFNYYRDGSKGWCNDIIDAHKVRCPWRCTKGARCSALTDNAGSERESIDCNSPKMKQCSKAEGARY